MSDFFASLTDEPRETANADVDEHQLFSHVRVFQKDFLPAELSSGPRKALDTWTERTLVVTEEALPGCLPFSRSEFAVSF